MLLQSESEVSVWTDGVVDIIGVDKLWQSASVIMHNYDVS